MDFQSLNRRELQSLCKLNKIPANITNIAMADALKSLETVIGIEEILNPTCSEIDRSSVKSAQNIEITSPRVPCTSVRPSNWKKVRSETESMIATASRGKRGGEFLKTPSVSVARKKGTTASTRENTANKETTVQRVYNTRRSARLTEKKCIEADVIERDISRPVKIASFLEEASVISEKSVGSGSSSVETSHESNISFENTEDNVGEGSVGNCDEGISKAKVEDICIEFEKLDVLALDGSDHSSVIEEKFILNEPEDSEEKSEQVDDVKPDSTGISNLCEEGDLEENIMVIDEKIDSDEALNVSFKVLSGEDSEKVDCYGENVDLEEKQKVEEKFILNEVEISEEKSEQADNIKPYSEGTSNLYDNEDSEEKMVVVDEKVDPHEALNDSVKEELAPEEHSDSFLPDEVLSGENSEEVDCCGENFDLEETQNDENKFILDEKVKSEQVDNIKQDLEGISNPSEVEDFEEKLMFVNQKVDFHEALNAVVKDYLDPKEDTNSLLCDKVLSEVDSSNTDSISCDTENSSDSWAYVSEMKEEALECNGSTNINKIPSELPELNNSDNYNVAMETTADLEDIEEDISTNTVDVNPNEEEPSKDFETPEESQVSLIKETVVDIMATINQETETEETITHESILHVPFIKETHFSTNVDDVIDHPTHATPIKNGTLNNNSPTSKWETSQVSDNNETVAGKVQVAIVEDNKVINNKAEDEKPPISLNDTSMRQLKKQLKALSIHNNLNTNKDD